MIAAVENLIKDRERAIRASKKEGQVEIIRNMLIENVPVQFICKVTGMSKKEINKINSDLIKK